jgi:hypothetical protein
MWLVNLIMLNMLLAIIMEVYMEVKGGIRHAETMFSQTREIWVRWRHRRASKHLHLRDICAAFDPKYRAGTPKDGEHSVDLMTTLRKSITATSDEDGEALGNAKINVEAFVKKVPGLSAEQALSILVEAVELHERNGVARGEDAPSKVPAKLKKVSKNVKHVYQAVDRLLQMQEAMSNLIATSSSHLSKQKGQPQQLGIVPSLDIDQIAARLASIEASQKVQAARSDQLQKERFDQLQRALAEQQPKAVQDVHSRLLATPADPARNFPLRYCSVSSLAQPASRIS